MTSPLSPFLVSNFLPIRSTEAEGDGKEEVPHRGGALPSLRGDWPGGQCLCPPRSLPPLQRGRRHQNPRLRT